MAVYETTQALRTVAINASTFTDIQGTSILPIDCDTVVIINTSSVVVTLATNPNNSSSQVNLQPGQQFIFGGFSGGARGRRYPLGCPAVCSLLSSSGNQNVLVESLQ